MKREWKLVKNNKTSSFISLYTLEKYINKKCSYLDDLVVWHKDIQGYCTKKIGNQHFTTSSVVWNTIVELLDKIRDLENV